MSPEAFPAENLRLNDRIQVTIATHMSCQALFFFNTECSCRLARDCHCWSLPWMSAMPAVRQQHGVAIPRRRLEGVLARAVCESALKPAIICVAFLCLHSLFHFNPVCNMFLLNALEVAK